MSFDFVRRCLRPDLPVAGLPHLILIILASHANEQGECWRAVPRIAAQARCTDRRVQSSLRALERLRLVAIRRGGPNGCNVYRLTLPAVPAGGDDSVTPLRRRPRGRSAFHKEHGGDASVTPSGDDSVTLTPASPVTLASLGGDAGVPHGATPTSPEASGSPKEADSTRADALTAATALGDGLPSDDSPEARWAAVVAAHDAGDGPFLTLRGASLRGEWLDKTFGEDAATVRAQLAQWRPNLPSAYGEQRAERDEDLDRAAQRRAYDERMERHRREQSGIAQAHAEAHRQRVAAERAELGPLLPRLLAWLDREDQEALDLADCIAADDRARAGLDLVRAGDTDGIKRLRAALDGYPRTLLDRALAEITTSAAPAPAAV